MQQANLDELYLILRRWALAGTPKTYKTLSDEYQAQTGVWLHWHGSWDRPLGDLNNRLAQVGAPALSALVILQDKNEPGGLFWGCAPNVLPRPSSERARTSEWTRILNDVRAYAWPTSLRELTASGMSQERRLQRNPD